MTDDLLERAAAAHYAASTDSRVELAWEACHPMYRAQQARAMQSALQAIHDAGFDLTPRAESVPWGKVTARAARLAQAQAEVNREGEFLVERIDDLDWSDFEGLTREWMGHVEPSLSRFRAALQAAQPNTEEKT